MENFEKKIKDKLLNAKVEIDTDALWAEVYPRIRPNRNRKALLYCLVGFLWLISLVAVGYYYKSDKMPTSDVVSLKSAEITNRKNVQTLNNQELLLQQKNVSSVVISNEEKEKDSGVVKEIEEINNKANGLKKSQNTTRQEVLKEVGVYRNAENSSTKASSPKDRNDHLNAIVQSPPSKTSDNTTEDNVTQELNIAKSLAGGLNDEFIAAFDNSITNNSASNTIPFDHDDESEPRSTIGLLKTLTSSIIPQLNFEYPQPVIPDELYSEHKTQEDFSRFSVYALGSLSMISRSLSTRDGLGSIDLDNRSSAESPLESFTGEFGLSYALSPNLQLSAGLNYIRINERVEDNYTLIDTVLLENVIIENIISSRGSEPVYGNIFSARTVNTNLTAYNRYTDVALSVDLTYLLRTEGLKPFVSVGIQQSIRSSQTGVWLLNSNELYDISQDPDSQVSSSYGLGVRLGAGFDINISDRSAIRLGGKYTKYVKSITSDSNPIKQKYSLLGISAGLNIKI